MRNLSAVAPWARIVILLCLILVWPFSARAEAPITLLLSDAGQAYQEVASAFQTELQGRRAVRVQVLGALSSSELGRLSAAPGLVVPVGLKATQALAQTHGGAASVLALLVPRASFAGIEWPAALQRQKRVSAVYLDQPLSRLLATVDAAVPAAKRVGVILSEENLDMIAPLRAEAARRRMSLNIEQVRSQEDVAAALRQTLPESDALLLVPDAVVVNAGSIQNVLLTTYRYRVPVIGFSQGLARAGAVVSVYTALGQMGQLGAEMARQWNPVSGELPSPRYPQSYAVAVNGQVARSLLLGVSDESALMRRIDASMAGVAQ